MTSDLRPYPEYKDSGVPWLGKIPAHWEIRASKRMFAESGERARPDDEQLSATQAYGVILQSDYEAHIGRKVVRILNHLEKRKHVEPDDFVISMRSFQGGLERAFARGAIRSSYVILKPDDVVHVPYFAHLFKSHPYIQALRTTSEFIRDGQDLTFGNFSRVPLPVVPPDEQKAIADYLDANAVKVRRFIRNRRRLIEVLNEQKQAIINQTVTRGLDPNAPLKPSGIDWLGNIPEHWEVHRLKNVATVVLGKMLKSTPLPGYTLRLYLRSANIQWWKPQLDDVAEMWFSDIEMEMYRLSTGDLLVSEGGEVGRACLWNGEIEECYIQNSVHKVSPNDLARSQFLLLQFFLLGKSGHFKALTNRVSIGHLTREKLVAVRVVIPPLKEQEQIVRWVGDNTRSIDRAIDRATREIDLIREYRTRLIADVVTGKLDARQASVIVAEKKTKKPANVYFRRSVFAAEIVHRLHDEPTFGHVKFEKLIFLCEKRCGVDTGSTYYRQAAGPYDNRALRSIDSQIKKQKWYEVQKHDKGYRYVPLEKAGDHTVYFDRYFRDVATSFNEIIDTFRTLNTQRCEIVATLYAAWEDLLTQGNVSDDQIIEQVLHHWHPSKQKIDEDRWRRALGWMKAKGLTPETGVNSVNN